MARLACRIRACRACALHRTRQHALAGEGSVSARIFLVALGPGAREDREGRMFVGPSGRVLDELLAAAGLERHRVFMSNLVKCRLPGNREPAEREVRTCGRHLAAEFRLVAPRVIVPLGFIATRAVFRMLALPPLTRAAFGGACGRIVSAHERKIVPLRHPSALLHGSRLKSAMLGNYARLVSC